MPRVPTREEVQTLLSALLLTRKEAQTFGVPLAQLNQDYRDQEGTNIPHRQLGYACLIDLLQSLTGGLTIRYRNGMFYAHPVVTEKTRHVSSLVAGQNSKRFSRGGRRPFRQSPCYPKVSQPPVRLDSRILADVIKLVNNSRNGVHMSRVLEYVRDRLRYNLDSYDFACQLRDISHEIFVENEILYSVSSEQQRFQDASRMNGESRTGNGGGVAELAAAAPTVNNNKKSCNTRPAGFSESEDDYEDGFESSNNVPKPEIVKSNENEGINENTVDPRNRDEPEETSPEFDVPPPRFADKQTIAMLIHERIKIRLQKLIEKHPEGIWCAELPGLYLKEYTIPLAYEEIGFRSVSDFAAHLPEIFHYARLQDKGDFKLFNAKATKPDITPGQRPKVPSLASLHNIYEQYVEPTEPVPTVLSKATVERLVPDGVMRPGETVPQICVTELDRGINEYIDVYVVDVFTPSFFWIHLIKRVPKFCSFMDDLHTFYEVHANKYVLPIAVMEKGMNCACIYDGKWHRAIIKTVRPDNQVTVLFYDYGTIQTYSPTCIHFLHRSFSNLPAQAIPCGLYNVKPVEGTRWLRNISHEFLIKVLNVPLVATIASIDTDNNSMLVGLTNTEETEDFHINDWMVQAGLAIYGKMVCMRPRNYPYQRFLECETVGNPETGKESLSSDSRNVCLERNNVNELASISNGGNVGFYNILLKLHLASRAGKNSSKFSIKSRTRTKRENSRFFNDVKSQAGKNREPEVVTSNFMTHEARTRGTGDRSTGSRGERYGTGQLIELCESYARQNDTRSVSNTDSNLDKRGDVTYTIVDASTSSSSIDTRNNNVFDNDKEIYNEYTSDEREISYEKVPSDETEISDDIEISDATIKTLPLHLRENTGTKENLPEFGTMRSKLGGHGRMEPINWSDAWRNEKIDEKPRKLSTASRTLNESSVTKQPDTSKLPRAKQDFGNIFDAPKIKENPESDKSRDKCSTNEHANIVHENKKSFDLTIGESTSKIDSSTCPKLPKSKRALWNIVKSNSEKRNSNIDKTRRGNDNSVSTEFFRKFERRTDDAVVESSTENTPETSPETRDKFFFNTGERNIPEFGKFHSLCGGNGRLEPITWSELRRIIKNPVEAAEVLNKAQPSFGESKRTKVPQNLSKADKLFTRILDEIVLPSNRDAICEPEGDIKMGGEVTPSLRMLKKMLERDRSEQVRIFIPNNVLKLMSDGDDAKDSPKPEPENSLSESIIPNDASEVKNREKEMNLQNKKMYDMLRQRICKVAKKAIARETPTSSESLPEMSDEGSDPPRESSTFNGLVEFPNSERLTDEDIQRASELRKNSSSSANKILQISPPTVETTDRVAEKRSSPMESNTITTNENSKEKTTRRDEKIPTSPVKDINAWLQSICLKPNSRQLSKLIEARLDSTNDSGLDSDDFSTVEEINPDKEKTFVNDDCPASPINNLENNISRKIVDKVTKEETPRAESDKESIEKKCQVEAPRINESRGNDEESLSRSSLVNSEILKRPLSVVDESAVKLTKNYPEFIPVFHDNDIKSGDEDDDDEWDYSPGWFETEFTEAYKKGIVFDEILPVENSIATERPRLETICNGDESSLEISDNADSSPSGSSRQETDTDTQPIGHECYSVNDTSGNTNSTSIKNSTFTKQDSSIDDFEPHESSRSHDFSTDKEPLINPDELFSSSNGTPEGSEIFKTITLPENPYSILSEIRKSKILNTSYAFAPLDSSSSGEKSDRSSKRSLINALKRYI